MARRRKKEPTFVDLAMQLAVGCAFLLAFNITFSNYGASIGGAWLNPLLVVIILVLTTSIGFRIYYVQEKLKKANIQEIDKMSGTMFERYLEQFFKRKGWQVKRTGGKGDYGADLILISTTKKVVIQAKRWKKNVGYEAIQQAYTSKDVYSCHEAWVVTNSGFTEQARDGAKRLGVKLWDREILIEQMANINAAQTITVKETEQIDENATEHLHDTRKQDDDLFICARCGKPVTNKVKDYCLANPKRFNGRIYCYDHQRS
ncbi:restriction system protein [Paenibacillus cellulosilyticus]|uniref:Restriction system protein n=1 Tax=Paenibacillus cellulosilyticus TaxID=375489 RepID=A0A2V2YT65_9BACL|nr:restriction endonuclease [Paenibacillus cellulosilyticus]PWW02507.1 restriction system protein [Paenibacillus cellulosilyticus]QKS47209.1 restriction endonuclease [Paenibacillus cellulosilyticus]